MEDRFKYKILNTKTNKFVEKGVEQYLLRYDGVICLCYFESIEPMYDLKPIFCTGLKDKNGKLIYEGDIVKTKDKLKLCVKYNPETFNLSFWEYFNKHYFEVGHLDSKDQCELYKLEIIGNVYENPKLIKGDEE